MFPAFTNRWDKPLGTPNKDAPQGKLTGGHEAAPYSHPYLVSLQIRFLWMRAHLCGGTLLNKYWVLTAGHCVKESWVIRWLPMDAVVGAHDVDHFGPETQVATINKRIPHPHYKGGIGPNDIAVLQTSTPFYFSKAVQPVNLPINFKYEDLDYLKLAGWGVLKSTFFFPALPGKLQEANVTYIPYDECYEAIEKMKEDNEENPLNRKANICSGPLTGGIAGCNGDSGGPLIHFMKKRKFNANNEVDGETQDYQEDYTDYDENGNLIKVDDTVPVVLGVVSWGVQPCGQEGAPTVYTKVSTYLDFINQYVKNYN
ncbi:hypothetical protein O0L34_g7296 [Tuta absoluta]|nr:hypothetical protein O0L34_g7296 [Tuta absoluta]